MSYKYEFWHSESDGPHVHKILESETHYFEKRLTGIVNNLKIELNLLEEEMQEEWTYCEVFDKIMNLLIERYNFTECNINRIYVNMD